MNKIGKKSEDQWRRELTPEQFAILRDKGTEAPFSGEYVDEKKAGMYRCAACGHELFSSDSKFDSGTGWPSFSCPVASESVTTQSDSGQGLDRTEVICQNCGAHLGHVFNDGPKKMSNGAVATGQRYCINSIALKLETAD